MSVFNDDPFEDDVPQEDPVPTLHVAEMNSPVAPALSHDAEAVTAESPAPDAAQSNEQAEFNDEDNVVAGDATAQPFLFGGAFADTTAGGAEGGGVDDYREGEAIPALDGAAQRTTDDSEDNGDGLPTGKKRSREPSNAAEHEDTQPASQVPRTEVPAENAANTPADFDDGPPEDVSDVGATMEASLAEYQDLARAETVATLRAEVLSQNLRIAALTEELRSAQAQRASLDDALRAPVIQLSAAAPPASVPPEHHLTDRAALQSAQGTAMMALLELESAQRAQWFAEAKAAFAQTACEWSRRLAAMYYKTLQEAFRGVVPGGSSAALESQKAADVHNALVHRDESGDANKALSALPSEVAQIRKAVHWITKWAERHSRTCSAAVDDAALRQHSSLASDHGTIAGDAATDADPHSGSSSVTEPPTSVRSDEWLRLKGLLAAVVDRLCFIERACESQSTLMETWRRAVDGTMGAIVEPRVALVLEVFERLAEQRPPTIQETASELELREVRQRQRVLEAVVATHVLGEGTSFAPQSVLPAVFKEQVQKIGQLEATVEEYKRQLAAAHRLLAAGLVGSADGIPYWTTSSASAMDGGVGQDLRMFAAHRWHKYATQCTEILAQLARDRAEARHTVATLRKSLATVADYSALLFRVASQLRNDVAVSEADNVVLREALRAAASVLPHVTHSTGEALDAEGTRALVHAIESLSDHVQRIAAPRSDSADEAREAWICEREAAIRDDIRNASSGEGETSADRSPWMESRVVSFLCTALRSADDALAEACGMDPVASDRITEGLSRVAEWVSDDLTTANHADPAAPIVLSTLPRPLTLAAPSPRGSADGAVEMLRESFLAEIGRHQARWEWLVKQTNGSVLARVAELEKVVVELQKELAAKTTAVERGESVARELLLTQTKLRDQNAKLLTAEEALLAEESARRQCHTEMTALQQQISDANQERRRLEEECLRLQQLLVEQQQQLYQQPEPQVDDEPCDDEVAAEVADETLVAEDQSLPVQEDAAVAVDDPLQFAEEETE